MRQAAHMVVAEPVASQQIFRVDRVCGRSAGVSARASAHNEDKAVLAAVYDGLDTMKMAMRSASLSFTTTTGDSEWEARAGHER
jgi:hypothetical protein